MPSITKVLLLLAVVVCISTAQRTDSGQQCLCQNVRRTIPRSEIKDVQIYTQTAFCNKVEIVVTTNIGRFCLNPQNTNMKKLMDKILKVKKSSATVSPTGSTSDSARN